MPAGWETPGAVPLPPKNLQVVSPYRIGMIDLRWDDPTQLARNAGFNIVGVNIYRSEASDLGPFRRINEYPIGGAFYRDRTDYARIDREQVTGAHWLFKGDAPNDRRWVFKTRQPIAKRYDPAPHQEPAYASDPKDVQVWVNGVEVPVASVFGKTGEVTLINASTFDQVKETWEQPALPVADTDVVEVSYYTSKNHVRSGLETNIWYRVASVAVDATTPSGYVETPLEWCEPKSLLEVEQLDYIWREAMRRNAWILQQGGERVRFFIRKTAGIPCDCGLDARTLDFSQQPSSRCQRCFGTGFLRGYEGPYPGVIVPDDGERRIAQALSGRHKEHTYEVWTSPSPLLTQRDFIVKQTNERYSVGPARRPSHRGNLLQQHFNIRYLDQGDIRYQVPMDGTHDLPWPETRGPVTPRTFSPRPVDGEMTGNPPWPVATADQHPMATEKGNIPDERERRGRTRVWENTEY